MNTTQPAAPVSEGSPSRAGVRLLLVASALVFVFGALGVVLAWRNERSEVQRVTDQAGVLANTAAADAQDFLRSRIALLQSVALSPPVLGGNRPAITLYFEQVLAAEPSFTSLGWVDGDGLARVRAPGTIDTPIDVSGSPYFVTVAGSLQPYVSDVLNSPLLGNDVIVIAVPVRDTGGWFAGVVAASITIADLDARLASRRASQEVSYVLVSRSGQSLTGGPVQMLGDSPLIARARARGAGVERDTTGVRGDPNRLVAHAPVPAAGWQLLVEQPTAEAYGPARRTLTATVFGLLLMAGLAIGGVAWAGRRLDRAALAEMQAQRDRQESLALLDTILENAPVGLGFFDRSLRTVRLNSALAALGSPAGAERGSGAIESGARVAPQLTTGLRQVLDSGASRLDVELRDPIAGSTESRTWATSYFPVHTPDGATLGVGAIATEITERKHAERERSLLLAREHAARLAAEQSAARTARLQAITAALSETLTRASVAQVAQQQARAAVGARTTQIGLIDRERGLLSCVRTDDTPDAIHPAEQPLDAVTPLSDVAHDGTPRFFGAHTDLEAEYPGMDSPCGDADDCAWAVLPLRVRGTVTGAMAVIYDAPRTFDADERLFLDALAGQCAQALERARLFEAEREARAIAEAAQQRLTFLASASTIVSASLEYEATMQSVARLAVPMLGDWCAIDGDRGEGQVGRVALVCTDSERESILRELEQRYPIRAEDRQRTVALLHAGRSQLLQPIPPEMLERIARDPEHLALLRQLDIGARLSVPMIARGRLLGALTVARVGASRRYEPNDVALVEELARRAAVAVDNALLYRQARDAVRLEQQRAAQLRGLSDASLVINSAPSLQSLMESVTQQARAIIGARSAMARLAPDGAPPVTAVSPTEGDAAAAPAVTNEESGLLRWVRTTNQPLRLTAREVSEHPAHEAGRQVSSYLAAPLTGRTGEAVGAIELRDRQDGDFTADDEAVLVQLAQLSSVAAQNSRLTAELQESVRVRDEFLASVTHDLRSPLTSIKGFAQMLARRVSRDPGPNGPALSEGLARIDAGTTRMMGLIDQLLDVARLQIGQPLDLNRRPTDLVALLRRAADEYALLTARHPIRVHTDTPELVGAWDSPRLERVFVNLISNAVKYSPDGGEITITICRTEDASGQPWAETDVSDLGLGIPPDEIGRVFERFYRGANVVGRIAGSGIGLSGARQIVEQHGGTISVRNNEDRGCTFRVRLPLYFDDQDDGEPRSPRE